MNTERSSGIFTPTKIKTLTFLHYTLPLLQHNPVDGSWRSDLNSCAILFFLFFLHTLETVHKDKLFFIVHHQKKNNHTPLNMEHPVTLLQLFSEVQKLLWSWKKIPHDKKKKKLRHKTNNSYRAVVIVVIIVFLRLGLLLLGRAPFCSSAAPFLLFAAARPLLLFPPWRIVAAFTVRSLSAVFRLLHPTHVHGFRRADGKLLHQQQPGQTSAHFKRRSPKFAFDPIVNIPWNERWGF